MGGIRDLVGTGHGPVSRKLAVKSKEIGPIVFPQIRKNAIPPVEILPQWKNFEEIFPLGEDFHWGNRVFLNLRKNYWSNFLALKSTLDTPYLS